MQCGREELQVGRAPIRIKKPQSIRESRGGLTTPTTSSTCVLLGARVQGKYRSEVARGGHFRQRGTPPPAH